MINGEENCKN
uniref:Uncharacterized protein n=1 Tax=Anguilla anguilla TaxID=7936 RepID=A0A0E9XP21_ANGAN